MEVEEKEGEVRPFCRGEERVRIVFTGGLLAVAKGHLEKQV